MMETTEHRLSSVEADLKEAARLTQLNSAFLRTFSIEMKEFKDEMREFKHEMSEFKDEMSEFKDEMSEFKDEMSEFKDEMSEFKDEMSEFKDEMSEFKDEMSEFKDEMSEFKDEMKEFKSRVDADIAEMRADRKAMNRKWGDLANKMGTLVEDVIFPGFPGILRRYFNVEADVIMVNVKARHPKDRSRIKEFDLIAYDDTRVFYNETKSAPKLHYMERFVETYRDIVEYFPQYADKTIVPFVSCLDMPNEIVSYLTEHNCYAVTLGDDHLDIVNFDEVTNVSAPQAGP